MTRHLLVAHDGGEAADVALSFALREYPDATVTVLHVVEPFPDHTAAGVPSPPTYGWRERADAIAETVFERARGVASDVGADVETAWVYGRPRHAIVEYVEKHPVDQVVVGSRGRDAVSRVVLGSVAEAVVRRSPVPVTVIR